MTVTSMRNHLDRMHSEEIKAMTQEEGDMSASTPPAAPAPESRKRGSGSYTQLFVLCPQKRRKELFQSTIPNWVEAKTMLPFGSKRAQELHKSIFEQLIMDNGPFYEVGKPGFLRTWQVAVPNFKVASEKYYRSMLEPAYDGIRYVIRNLYTL